jgi:hypothetical protein
VIPSRRRAVLLLPIALALLVGACTSSAAPVSPPTPTDPPPSATPLPSVPTLPPTGSEPPLVSKPPTGNTDERYPELAISGGEPGHIVELTDPTAKAWRIVVSGQNPDDRLELLVEVGDIVVGVIVTTVVDGRVVDELDLSGMVGNPTAAAGGCHPVLEACYSSGGIDIDLDAGRVGLIVERIGPASFEIVGSTAGWPDQPFVLGPWRSTAPFLTGWPG